MLPHRRVAIVLMNSVAIALVVIGLVLVAPANQAEAVFCATDCACKDPDTWPWCGGGCNGSGCKDCGCYPGFGCTCL
jgi:hypothetical protein